MDNYLIETSVPPLYKNWVLDALVGPDNIEEIKHRVSQYLNSPTTESNGDNLYLYSLENGTGKTSLAYFILGQFNKPRIKPNEDRVSLTSVVAVKYANYLKLCKESFDQDAKISKRLVERAPVLLIDDVSKWANTNDLSADKREFILLMMYRREHLLPTIVTSNLPPDEFQKTYGPTATSKVLENFSYIKIDGGDMRSVVYQDMFEKTDK